MSPVSVGLDSHNCRFLFLTSRIFVLSVCQSCTEVLYKNFYQSFDVSRCSQGVKVCVCHDLDVFGPLEKGVGQ